MDALGLGSAVPRGYDWGGRAACISRRCGPSAAGARDGRRLQHPEHATPGRAGFRSDEHRYWYQWYFNTERGRSGLEQNRREICRLLWQQWSPAWRFDDATFDRTARQLRQPRLRRRRDPLLPPSIRGGRGRPALECDRAAPGRTAAHRRADRRPARRRRHRDSPTAGEEDAARFPGPVRASRRPERRAPAAARSARCRRRRSEGADRLRGSRAMAPIHKGCKRWPHAPGIA